MDKDSTRHLRATAHPSRLRMLSLLTGASLSAAQVARELGISQANASYHLRVLLAAGRIEVAGQEQVRGGRATLYRHPWRQDAQTQETGYSDADRQAWVAALAEAMVRRGREQAPSPGAFTDAELWVTPEDLEAVRAGLVEASARLHEAARPPRTPGTVRVSMSAALFQMTPADPPGDPR